ncbi:uncharacterized protein K452DRAFT_54353 [Aplosporella prunicola CBS 121167]|uniref:GRAM domain-containing protein n=1 Tax=Aplosporella prunicola CBS 121167 TaxID=1176127 RepID=A0A6A6BAC5_9PEZI|nr:uncharacterized protein K452DRAFT_54353 [Aplosporella prunicola CBS 121167]KAF2140333.1 hypothetical protein K452DRAFT_54353 [Aplosporella prunicola CBS 121167]
MSAQADDTSLNTYSSSDVSYASARSPSNASSTNDASPPRRWARVHHISQKAKSKAMRTLHIDDTEAQTQAEQDVQGDPAFNPQSVFCEKTMTAGRTLSRTTGAIQKAGYAIIHPRDSVKCKAATRLAAPEQPLLSQEADNVLIEAHERLERAQQNVSPDDEERPEALKEIVDNLESHRESMRVAWTTSRFIHRVRVVPSRRIELPRIADFDIHDEQGRYVRTDWIRYLGNYALYATQDSTTRYLASDDSPFNRDIMVEHVERIMMASAPWQSYFLTLRKIWRWEDPYTTGKWLAIFLFVWLIDYVITFCLCYVVFIVVWNRHSSRSVNALRESHERALDQGATAFKISELIHRHGAGRWIDPVIDEVGPRAQVQLHDLANFLEMLQNFYQWRFPEKTLATLFTFCMAIALGAFTPTGYSMRVVTLVLILWFFAGRPIGSYHPKYRHIVSPIAYVFWDVPTHAQWSFRYLRNKAESIRQRAIERAVKSKEVEKRASSVTMSDPGGLLDDSSAKEGTLESQQGTLHTTSGIDDRQELVPLDLQTSKEEYFMTFRCRYHGVPGRLAISATGISFIRLFPAKELWRHPFHELTEIRKMAGSPLIKGIGKDRQLALTFTDGSVERMEGMKTQEEAFNSIIGFSGLQWQNLEPLERENHADVGGT